MGTGGPGTSGVVTVEGQRYSYGVVEAGIIGYERLRGDGDGEPYAIPQTQKERADEKEPDPGYDWGKLGQIALVAGVALLTVAAIAAVVASGGAAAAALAPAATGTAALLFTMGMDR